VLRLEIEDEADNRRPPRPLPTNPFPQVSPGPPEKLADARVEQVDGESEERFVCRRPTRRMRRRPKEEMKEVVVARRKQVSRPPPPNELINERWVGAGGGGRCGWAKWQVVREPGLEAVVEEE
jgi:hypothetical protein